ncbi:prephenate dehydrogenase [Tuberibacillus calidus]|uniref:prephenate dehydrogenase n=1 Tax=Tuberibacillus calidus TaxID=340097 RepID=UPI000485F205|nr:prephenate dehydrogenase [Tuberibacillus calidus]
MKQVDEKMKVLIAGIGLIGGSLGRAIRKGQDVFITGWDIDDRAAERALELGIIDEKAPTLEAGAKEADIIILASPVGSVLQNLDALSRMTLKPDVIITDTGSTKKTVCEHAKKVLGGRYLFIGGHPMAGSHKSGVEAANGDLFENAFFFLTPEADVPALPLTRLKDILKGTRAKFMTIDPATHDRIVGVLSHFPHIVAAALVHHLKEFNGEGLDLKQFAAGGFRDITRIASSDPFLWQDIILHNRDVLLNLFQSWEDIMRRVKKKIKNGDPQAIQSFFREAKFFRDGFPIKQKGAIPSTNDLYVDISDRPGEIAKVTGLLAEAGISLTNIQIIEWREAISGVLRLSFRTVEDRDQAAALLQNAAYNTYFND